MTGTEEPIPVLVVSAGEAMPRDLVDQLREQAVIVVGQATEVQLASRMCATRAPRAVLLLVADPGDASFVTALTRNGVPIVALARTPAAGVAALTAGALETLPEGTPAAQIVEALQLMSKVRVVRRHDQLRPGGGRPHDPRIAAEEKTRRLVLVGSSTGGPPALVELLGRLPADFPAPILVAQHMPAEYETQFASWLGTLTGLRVTVPIDGELAEAGAVYIGRGSRDLWVGPGGYMRHLAPLGAGPMPSADRLLDSAAQLSGFSLFGVVLSGMGRDGMTGLKAVRQAGGQTLVQDAASSTVFSMPEASLQNGAADLAMPPWAIGDQLVRWAFGERPKHAAADPR